MENNEKEARQQPQKKENDRYKIETSKKPLGTGGFSEVVIGYDRLDKKYVAVKIFKSSKKNVENYWRNEYRIMRDLRHPNIVIILDFFDSNGKFYIVSELMKGGELFDRIIEKRRFSEKDAVNALLQILSAVNHMHDRNIVHRDMKPENILYVTKKADSPLKVTDFGVAGKLKDDGYLTTFVGSKYYVAPEILKESPRYGKSVDLWSIGIITYILLVGYPPFDGAKPKDVYNKVKTREIPYDPSDWRKISDPAKDFVRRLLTKDPKDRLDSPGALRHPWLTGKPQDQDLEVTDKIKSFKAQAQWKVAFNVAKALSNFVENYKDEIDVLPSSMD